MTMKAHGYCCTVLWLAALALVHDAYAFTTAGRSASYRRSPWGLTKLSSTSPAAVSASTDSSLGDVQSSSDGKDKKKFTDEGEHPVAVRAPLKFIGPYPTLALRFPKLATSSQRSRNATGVSLDFVLDTAANVNTINGQVAKELELDVVGSAVPGVGASGALSGGDTFMLGDTELEGVGEKFTFMTGLTASALPVASPAAAGLMSLAFLQSFQGVEFTWGSSSSDGEQKPAAVTFLSETPPQVLEDLVKVPIQRIPVTQLPSVTIEVNGVKMPALLDTGSPVTVFNAEAARRCGIDTVQSVEGDNKKSGNPLSNMASRLARAQAASRGDVLTILGSDGRQIDLLKSSDKTSVKMLGSKEFETVIFGESRVYVGDLPGLAALNGLGVDSPPAVVLGMDVLRTRPKMLLKAQNDEVWF